MSDEIMLKYMEINGTLKSSKEELIIIEEELEKIPIKSYNSEIVNFLICRKEELEQTINHCNGLLNVLPLIDEKISGKDRIMLLLMDAEDEYYDLDEKIDDMLESSVGYDNEEIQTFINHREKLALKIYYCRDLLNLNNPEREKILQK